MASLNNKREEELEQWEEKLVDQQTELTNAMKAFREEMQHEAARLQEYAIRLSKKENALKAKERRLLTIQQQLQVSVAAYAKTIEESSDVVGHQKTMKTYEGKVEGEKGPSYVESISDSEDEEEKNRQHRGLRGSPQHVPLNPDNDNMFFRRKSSLVDLKGREKPMQQKFDDAVEILLARYEPEAIIAMMQEQGLTAKDIIAMAENLADEDLEGDDDAGYDDEEQYDDDDNGEGEQQEYGDTNIRVSGARAPGGGFYYDDIPLETSMNQEEDGKHPTRFGGGRTADPDVTGEYREYSDEEEEEEYEQDEEVGVTGGSNIQHSSSPGSNNPMMFRRPESAHPGRRPQTAAGGGGGTGRTNMQGNMHAYDEFDSSTDEDSDEENF